MKLQIGACILVFNFLILIFSDLTAAQTQSSESLPMIVLNSAAEPPLTNESHTGFLDELAEIIFKKIGYRVIIDKLPAERALKSANSGLIDGEIIRIGGINKIYSNLIPIPVNLIVMEFVAFSKKPIDMTPKWDALSGKEVAFITGWKIYEKMVPKTASITKANNTEELFRLLSKNRTDVVLHNKVGGFRMIYKLKLKDVYLQNPILAKKEMFMYLHNKHKSLIPKLTSILKLMKKDGSYQRLEKKHFGIFN